MKANRKYIIFVIVTASLFGTVLTLQIVFSLISALADNETAELVLDSWFPITAAAFAISLFAYFAHSNLIRSIQVENEYILGKRSNFNNLYVFQKRSSVLAKHRQKQSQHIISFTFSNLVISQNVNRNFEIFSLNSHIVDYLQTLYKDMGARRHDFVFAFSRGAFLIYTFKQNEQSIQKIADLISKEIYRYAEAECQHVWVQPFFGVSIVNKDESITQQVENSLIARDYSERNFETITFYQPSFRRTVSSNDIDELQQALNNGEFVVYYQPKYDLTKKRFISSEALIRWKSEKYGFLTPTKFLGKAEAVGLTHEIDTFVLKRVCEDLDDLRRRGKRLLPVSVNFSLYEFYSANFLDTIMVILEQYKIPTHLIEIEITEATSQANQFLSLSIIKKLKEKGMRVLMDDFGVGFSNIGNLKKIPFDAVKIDKSFIDDIASDMKTREIVRFLINLCKVNELEVIAEGVDNKEQLDLLRKIHCDTIQGFYFSQPLSKQDFEKFLNNNPFEKKEEVAE